jgi:hypothetical protein
MVRLGYYRPVTVLQQRIIWIMAYTSAGIRYNKFVWSTQIAISRLANVGIWLATSLCHHWQITTSLPQHHVAHRTNVMSNTWLNVVPMSSVHSEMYTKCQHVTNHLIQHISLGLRYSFWMDEELEVADTK